MVNATFPVGDPQSSVHDVPDATVVGQDGIHDDPAISLDQTDGVDANRSCEGGTIDKQNTSKISPAVQASVPAPTDEGELNNHSERKSCRAPQEQNDYHQAAASNQPISLRPQWKLESSTHLVMQIVSGLTDKTGLSHEKAGKLIGEKFY